MSAKTGIEWTDATWNPVVGCEQVSPGCGLCYAKTLHDMRHKAYLEGKPVPEQYRVPFEEVQLVPDRLLHPLRWREPRRIFVVSIGDPFHDAVPDSYLDRMMVVMAFARRHTFQLLTKRPERMRSYFSTLGGLPTDDVRDRWDAARLWLRDEIGKAPVRRGVRGAPQRRRRIGQQREYIGVMMAHTQFPLPNVWLGVSVEDQKRADERIPQLLATSAAVRFLSCEPLLGPLDIRGYLMMRGAGATTGIDWVIGGGESGRLAQRVRSMHPDWIRYLRDHCVSVGVPFLFKQWGDWAPTKHLAPQPQLNRVCMRADGHKQWLPSIPGYAVLDRVGKKKAGRVLDGRTWDEFPDRPIVR